MSYCSLIELYPDQNRFEEVREYKNSWGGAAWVWTALCAKYLGNRNAWLFDAENAGGLWRLVGDDRLSRPEKRVLAWTFDYAYVAVQDYAQFAADIREMLDGRLPGDGSGFHWREIAQHFDQAAWGDRTRELGTALHATSVNEIIWHGPWDDAKEDYGPFDWSQAWSVYDEYGRP